MVRAAGRRRPRFLILMLFFSIVAGDTAWCQATQQKNSPDVSQKKWQLKFAVGPNLMPDQFDGFKVYLQNMISERSALRLGVGIQNRNTDFNSIYRIIDQPDGYYRKTDRDDDLLLISFDFGYMRYIRSKTAIAPYIGIGPFFDYSLNDFRQTQQFMDFPPEANLLSIEDNVLDAGLGVVIGAEWRLSSLLVLHVEHRLRFYYERYRKDILIQFLTSTPGIIEEDTEDFDFYKLDTGDIKTGFSIMF